MFQADKVSEYLEDVFNEVQRQEELWGVQTHPDGTGSAEQRRQATNARNRVEALTKEGALTYWEILKEEFHEVGAAPANSRELIEELTQVAAVCLSWRRTIEER